MPISGTLKLGTKEEVVGIYAFSPLFITGSFGWAETLDIHSGSPDMDFPGSHVRELSGRWLQRIAAQNFSPFSFNLQHFL